MVPNIRNLPLIFLFSVGFAGATELNSSIDRLVSAQVPDDGPGCAVGVIHKGEYVHKAGYGIANLEYNVPIGPETVFRTGSVGKQFTAMAIAILAERGDLDLDADIHKYLPDLMDYGNAVTVRMMVHHIAGMGDYDHPAFRKVDGSEFRFGNKDYATIKEFYAMVTKAGLELESGAQYQYSNLGYFLLSQVVESVSDQTLHEFAEHEIFGRLGMGASLFNDNVNRPVPNRADGYQRMDDGSYEILMTNLSWVGDGGVYTNLDDFIHWDQNFYTNRLGKGEQSLIDLVTTPHPTTISSGLDGDRNAGYAFGLSVAEEGGEYMIGHTGSWVAFTANYKRFPDIEMSVVVFCNNLEASAYELGDEIAAIALQEFNQ